MARRKNALGLDIGSSSVKLVQFRESKKGIELANFSMAPLPSEAIVDGALMNSPAVVDTIQSMVSAQKLKSREVAVSVSGVIGWVGLVIPHAGRILVGPEHRRLIPTTLSLGASFLLLIDLIARTVLPGEVPLGVLTGLIGVPMLIVLLRRNRTGW